MAHHRGRRETGNCRIGKTASLLQPVGEAAAAAAQHQDRAREIRAEMRPDGVGAFFDIVFRSLFRSLGHEQSYRA